MIFKRHPLRKLGAIYAGGAVGALARVGLAEGFPQPADAWPWPTLVVNLLGAFLIGYFFASFRDQAPDRLRHPFFATGICGTLTTFSTMQLELFYLLDAGEAVLALGYATASLTLGYVALRLGIATETARTEARA